jgi:ASPIC and UnbV
MITHMYEQIRLLINETQDDHDRIAFKLVATDCSRDAIGAVIRFQSGGQRRTLWMLSGDGYYCSNEKTLIAGLGKADEVTDVTVTWQDGSIDQLGTLGANTQYLIIQGQGEAFPLYDYPPTNQ